MKKWIRRLRRRNARPGVEFLRAANAARDRQDWSAAVAAYGRYLEMVPSAADIWVQRAHAYKEAGDLARAEQCYRQAIDLDPGQGDPFVHLAHLLRTAGRPGDAADCCTRAATLGDRRALKEWQSFGVPPAHQAHASATLSPWITTVAAARLLADAQAKRDQRRWDEAEALYLRYLDARPSARHVDRELAFVRSRSSSTSTLTTGRI